MHDRLVAALRVERGADALDWHALLLLVRAPEKLITDGGIAKAWAAAGRTHFEILEIDYADVLRERGGVEAVLPQRTFVNLRASRFREVGQRVFLFNGQQFDLGIPTTITVTPLELTGGYRFDFGRRFIPYGGAGLGWHRYEETSRFADASENVNERFTGYHVMDGAEFRLAQWIGAAAEAQWTTVPDALGADSNSASHEFDESDLGGVTFRLKVVVGR